jgi:hypothetical protein
MEKKTKKNPKILNITLYLNGAKKNKDKANTLDFSQQQWL